MNFLIRFKNLGNTCYINAVLQSLMSLKTFTFDLKSIDESSVPQETLYRYLRIFFEFSQKKYLKIYFCLFKYIF